MYEKIPHTVVRSKRRTIALVIGRDATLTVRAPHRVSLAYIEELLNVKRDWIVHKQQEMLKKGVAQEKVFQTGEIFLFLGNDYTLNVCACAKIVLDYERGEILFPEKYLSSAKEKMIAWYKRQAHGIISERLKVCAEKYGLQYKEMKITSATTRWGSCSSTNSLNFSWRLIMARPAAVEYVIAHELAHTIHHNHSVSFWNRVEVMIPQYRVEEKWLKENSGQLRL